MHLRTLLISTIIFLSCNTRVSEGDKIVNLKQNKSANIIKKRILPPNGYKWVSEGGNSFGSFLQNLELKPHGAKILYFNGVPISNQSAHVAILNYDVGNRDLQQCADAVIRLRAEYLFERGRYSEIAFHFTSGDLFSWEQYSNGYRAIATGNNVSFAKTKNEDDSYQNFRKYLDAVYNYAGTISLNKETTGIFNDEEIKSGDILVTPGSPGHALIIVGRATNANNESVFLLAEGYTPAQSIHIIKNIGNDINPWYNLSTRSNETITARYTFRPTNIRRFK